MTRSKGNSIMTTFGTKLSPINLKEGLFVLTSDVEVPLDTPLEQKKGTKKIFKKGSVVKGSFWSEHTRDGKNRKVVMVSEDLNGRYLINKNVLEPTTKAEIEAKKAKEEVKNLNDKVASLMQEAKEESSGVESMTKNALEKEYLGFTGKQLLAAALGVIILIKVFK